MTPTATRLKQRLDDRRRWFQNEWFFKWHHIGGQRGTAIDMFDGRMAHYAGIAFWGSPHQVYWDAIVRGVRKEITDQFAWMDREVRNYNGPTALRAIDECTGLLVSFVRSIRREAKKKDRILRGDGISFPSENDAGHWHEVSDREIAAQAEALKASLPPFTDNSVAIPSVTTLTWRQRALVFWNNNQWWLGPMGLILGLVGVLPLIF